MNDLDNHKWPAVVFFLACGLFFSGCVWYLWADALNPDSLRNSADAQAAGSSDPELERNGRILLTKNHGVQVDGSRIVYRGRRDGDLHMDLYILQLDPHYGYPHRIDESHARKGFRLGEHHFRVLAASDASVSLKRL